MVARKIILFLFCVNLSFADQIKVEALSFYLDENTGKSILSGNVVVSHGKDVLTSGELTIFTDRDQKPIRYEATKQPKFRIVLKDKIYEGSGDKFIYDALKDIYEIDGNAYINEIRTDKKLYGDRIIVDRRVNIYRVESKTKKPARFVFDLDKK